MDNLKKEKEIDEIISREMSVSLKEKLAILRAQKSKISEPVVSAEFEPVVEPVIAPSEPEPQVVPPIPIEPEVAIPSSVPDEPKKEPIIPEVETGEGRSNTNWVENEPVGEKIIDVDFREIKPNVDQLQPRPEFSESDKRLVELGQKLEDARRFYVQQDREMDKGASIWKKIFGVGKRLEEGTLKQAFDEADARYQNALRDYKDAHLATGREEDVRVVIEWLTKGEFLSLESERIDLKVKEEKSWPTRVKEGYLDMVNRYDGLTRGKKGKEWAIGMSKKVALGVGATATGFAGGLVVAGVAAGVITAKQIFIGSVLAVGFKKILDTLDKNKKIKEGDAESAKILTTSRIEGSEELQLDALNKNLNAKIERLNAELQKRKDQAKYRNWKAVGAGLALSILGKYVAGGIGEYAKEHFGVGQHSITSGAGKISEVVKPEDSFEIGSQKNVMGIGYHPEAKPDIKLEDVEAFKESLAKENIIPAGLATGADNISEVADKTAFKGVELTVGGTKANSFEGIISEHLNKHPDLIEKYNQMDPKGRTFDAGQITTRMADDFAKTHNLERGPFSLVHEGFKAQFDPEHMKIMEVSGDDKMGWLADGKGPTQIFEKTEVSGGHVDIPAEESGTVSAVEAGDFLDKNAGVLLENTNVNLAEWQTMPERGVDIEKYATLGSTFTKSLAKLIGGNYFEDWEAIRGSSMKEVLKGDGESSQRMNAFLGRLLKVKLPEANEELVGQFKKAIKPKGSEKVFDWVKRIAILLKHSGIKKI